MKDAFIVDKNSGTHLPICKSSGTASRLSPRSRTCASMTFGTASRPVRWPLGETPPVIGKLLGHSAIETTARYVHLAQDSVVSQFEI